MDNEKTRKIEKIARDILLLSRNTLLVNLRFLDAALSRFKYVPLDEDYSTFLTDGKHLIYNPKHILKCYKLQKEMVVRDYLHIVMHCVFVHMFMNPSISRPHWDLACDIAVENMINDLGLRSTQAYRENVQQRHITKLKQSIKVLTAEKIYNYLMENNVSEKDAAIIRADFYADNHEIWYMSEDEKKEKFGLSGTNDNGDGDASNAEGGKGDWEGIASRMEMEVENFVQGKMRGNMAGSLVQNLKEVTREKYDYTAFLKKFAVMGEAMKINDDEFDYNFYTYGLKLYGNVPLIEPLEYKEVKRIKEFVIAIDTSGSTSGELVQKFIQKTYNILKSTESFFSKINIHIVQCDADIQHTAKITNQEEFDEYLKGLKIYGLGGTDFRPVFNYVDKLIDNKEFTNLKGLIYFTDGYGAFPSKKPDYETAFVFIEGNDGFEIPDLPPWAIKLILRKDEI